MKKLEYAFLLVLVTMVCNIFGFVFGILAPISRIHTRVKFQNTLNYAKRLNRRRYDHTKDS